MEKIKIELVVEGVNLDDEATDNLLIENFSDVLWGVTDGILTVTTFTTAMEPISDACALSRRIANLPGARVLRWNDDFVGYAEIARRSDVSAEAVRLWATGQRGPKTFPHPRGHVGVAARRSPIWRWSEISTWLDSEMHLGDGVAYPTEGQICSINAYLASSCAEDGKIVTSYPLTKPNLLKVNFSISQHFALDSNDALRQGLTTAV
jgi:hypothetical protein